MISTKERLTVRSWTSGRIVGDVQDSIAFFNESKNELNVLNLDQQCTDSSQKSSTESDRLSEKSFCNADFHDECFDSANSSYCCQSLSSSIDKNTDDRKDAEKSHELPCPRKYHSVITKHKTWLLRLQSAMRRRKHESEDREHRDEKQARKRKQRLLERAACKSKARQVTRVFPVAPIAVDGEGIDLACSGIETSNDTANISSISNDAEYLTRMKNARRKHKLEYRSYLNQLQQKREVEKEEFESSAQQAEEKKARVRKAALFQMKQRSHTLDPHSEEIEKLCYQQHSSVLTDKQKDYLAKTQRLNQLKEKELEKERRRLNRRATILKKKYEKNLPDVKVWERHSSKTGPMLNKKECPIDKDELQIRSESNHKVQSGNDTSYEEDTRKSKLSMSKVKALADRLTKSSKTGQMEAKRRKEQILLEQRRWKKVFSITGHYPSLRNALADRGWVMNEDRDSEEFDLQFNLAASSIDFSRLQSDQIVNHFEKSKCLTTKVGLVSTLLNAPLLPLTNHDKDTFFPRAYDLSAIEAIRTFVGDHHCLQARGALSRLLAKQGKHDIPIRINTGIVQILCRFLQNYRRRLNEDEFIDGTGFRGNQPFSPIESVIIQSSEDWLYREVTENELDSKSDLLILLQSVGVFTEYGESTRDDSPFQKKWKNSRKKLAPTLSFLEPLDKTMSSFIRDRLVHATIPYDHPQEFINGSSTENVWIIKPHGSSRGRGIQVAAGPLKGILELLKPSFEGGKQQQFIIQKYIERPLTIQGRKFDMRQWVLVTGWNPLKVWFFDDCYVRFAVEMYESQTKVGDEWANNQYRHLVNNSIGKKSKTFQSSFTVEETDTPVDGYMWSLDSFREWLIKKTGENTWDLSLAPAIKSIVVDTLLCAQETMLGERKRSFELYGFDIMLDSNYHPWLIEVNSSPACDYSTPVAESYVKRALPDILKVVLDIEWTNCQRETKDSGGWELIHSGNHIPKVAARFGSDLSIKGHALRKPVRCKHNFTKEPVSYERKSSDTPLTFDDSDLSDYEEHCSAKKKSEKITTLQVEKNLESNKENKVNRQESRNMLASSTLKHIQRFKKENPQQVATKVSVPMSKISLEMCL